MKLSYEKLIPINDTLQALRDKSAVDVKTSFKVVRNLRLLEPEIKEIYGARERLIRENGKDDGNGNISVPPEMVEDVQRQLNDLIHTEIEINLMPFKLDELQSFEMTVNQLDALYEIMGADTFAKNMEKGLIEVAPLAYMRGRTLDNAFVVLDEAQNTTPAQMKMFLTRIGFGSKAIITGDLTQKGLPSGTRSGLDDALHVLKNIDEIGVCNLTSKDVVRHPLVQKIVTAYDEYDKKKETRQKRKQRTTGKQEKK